jgi:transcriptional regulator with XRE-family HTH domain
MAMPFSPQPQGSELMPQTGLGVAIKTLRERRTLSLREIGQLSSVDHAYIHRLETGEKTNPSEDLIEKLLRVLKPSERDAALVNWLVEHADADPNLVEYVLQNTSIDIEIFTAAAGVRHRGNARPDPATLIARIKRAFEDDDEDD